MPTPHRIKSHGVTLQAYTYGSEKKTPIVLVHGYPDNHQVWEQVAERLAERYYVISYDVRGAGESDAPKRLDDYRLMMLAWDLEHVVKALIPRRPFHLVGHDWGSIQSWESVTGEVLKDQISSFTSISGPSLDHVGHWLHQNSRERTANSLMKVARQFANSWYIGLFHLPALAPTAWKSGLDRLWPRYLKLREHVDLPPENENQGKDGLNGIQLYRANVITRLTKPQPRPARCPVQLIVPLKDHYASTALYEDLHQWVPELYRRNINAHHWVLLSHPELITTYISEFVAGVESGTMCTALQHCRVKPERHKLPLAGRVAVITGAGAGIGRATALRLATVGADVVCVDIDAASAKSTAESARRMGADAWHRQADVSSGTAMTRLANWVDKQFGGADILINNAGIGLSGGILDTEVKDWQEVLNVNLWGTVHGCRLFARQMVDRQRKGHIINVASAAAFAPNRHLAAYATSKAAVHMLSECVRGELADSGIAVTSLCPGIIATGVASHTRFSPQDNTQQDTLLRQRQYSADEVAEAIYQAVLHRPALSLVGPDAWRDRLISRFIPAISRYSAQH